MRSLRKLRGFALATASWALVMGCWLLPGQADAAVPQAPVAPSELTISATITGATFTLSGSLKSGGQPVADADIAVTLDAQALGTVRTGVDGSYSISTGMPGFGSHTATATFAGDALHRQATASQHFTINPPATSAPATTAPATTAPPPATVITAQLSPSPVPAGSVLVVSGTLTAGGVAIDSALVSITCDFGGQSMMGATDAGGTFTANLSLPATGQPSKLTVTVSYAGDNRFSPARASFQTAVTAAAPSASTSDASSVAPESAPPSVAEATPTAVASSATLTLRGPETPATTLEVVLGVVGVGALLALAVLWVLAWRRHDLMPDERRGFGSDFGRREGSA